MLKSAQNELNILDVNGYDRVEELDALIVLLIKLTNRATHKSVEEGTTIDFPNLEYNAIKVSKYTNENGTFEYKISNEVEYICPDKIVNEITEEEFISYFTNAA